MKNKKIFKVSVNHSPYKRKDIMRVNITNQLADKDTIQVYLKENTISLSIQKCIEMDKDDYNLPKIFSSNIKFICESL